MNNIMTVCILMMAGSFCFSRALLAADKASPYRLSAFTFGRWD